MLLLGSITIPPASGFVFGDYFLHLRWWPNDVNAPTIRKSIRSRRVSLAAAAPIVRRRRSHPLPELFDAALRFLGLSAPQRIRGWRASASGIDGRRKIRALRFEQAAVIPHHWIVRREFGCLNRVTHGLGRLTEPVEIMRHFKIRVGKFGIDCQRRARIARARACID